MASVMRHVSPRRIRSDLYSFSATDGCSTETTSPCILSVLSALLERVVVRNERQSAAETDLLTVSFHKTGVFHGLRIPDITLERYLERIFKYVCCSPSVFVVAYAYIDRVVQLNSGFRITSHNVHRLLITSVMIAAKFLEDTNYNNAFYAKVGGLSTKEINRLEIAFLTMLDFRLQVTVSVFESYCAHLEREVALGGGYQIERVLRYICAFDESSSSKESQKEDLSSRCRYLCDSGT